VVLCSTARRAVDTLDGVDPGGERRLEPGLYGASAEELLLRLRRLPGSVREAMVLGHNPGLQMLVLRLVSDPQAPELTAIRSKLPTGALVTLEFTGAWSSLTAGSGRLTRYVTPRSLPRKSS
jgi:phosphohistidine phosphatase